MKKISQSGFAATEAILVLVIVAMLAGTGYFVWHAKQNTDKTLNDANKSASSKIDTGVTKDVVDSKTGFATFKSVSGVFSVQYPSTWVKPENTRACGDYLKNNLEIGPNQASVSKCGGDGTVSQVAVSFTTAAKAGNPGDSLTVTDATGKSFYKDYSTGTITVDGIQGSSYSAIASGQTEGIGSLPDGTIVVIDYFKKGDNVVLATYTQLPSTAKEGPNQDQRAVFDQIVKSIKFLK